MKSCIRWSDLNSKLVNVRRCQWLIELHANLRVAGETLAGAKASALVFALVIFSLSHGSAQVDIVDTSATVQPKKERKQTLNFEDELVEGSTQKPELFYLFQKKNFNYKKLIKLRENFLPEMRDTAEDIQRLRGGH